MTDVTPWSVLRAQSGDLEALDELFRAMQSPLHRYISGLTKDGDAADDILQETFIRIHRNIRWLREPELFRAWAYRIATRETWRHLRREQRRSEPFDDVAASEVIDERLSPEVLQQLSQSIDELSPASRAVILLFYFHDLSLADVAAALSIPIGTVKSRLHYGLKQLRQHHV
jgi:RNA polymerase sigma-70 factor (ECF subfamily)